MIYFLMHEDEKLAICKYENQHIDYAVINDKLRPVL